MEIKIIFIISSMLWGILIGIFYSVISLILLMNDNSYYNDSRISLTIASRKLEFIALIIPISGVISINQFVIVSIFDNILNSIDITGLQWYWVIDNCDITYINSVTLGNLLGLFITNTLILSINSVIILTAIDVIHAIAIPTLGIKSDAIPGRLSLVKFSFEIFGYYSGQCSELCGAMHAFMPLVIMAELK